MRFIKTLIFSIVLSIPFLGFASVSTLVADTKSGLILASKNSNLPQYPASLTKVMTLYMTFSALEKGILKMDDMLPVSRHAANQPRSKLYVRQGQKISVKDAIMALIIISANDVAVVLAEALAPSEEEFAKMMTSTAQSLGLKNTTFKNASGLHHKEQLTTAQDMAILTMATIHHFPQYYKLFSERTFTYRGRKYRSHNHVQKKYRGAEGLKTGYISAVGYNIISTAKRNNNRLVSVVIGQDSVALRDRQAMNLLDRGFSKIAQHKQNNQTNMLNRRAIIEKPDLMPHLITMATRLDKIIHSKSKYARVDMLTSDPLPLKEEKTTLLAFNEPSYETAELDEVKTTSCLIEQGSNTIAEEEAELNQEEDIESNDTTIKEATHTNTPLLAQNSDKEDSVIILSNEEATPSLPQAVEMKNTQHTGYGIQVGAFSLAKNAEKQNEKALVILNLEEKNATIERMDDYYRARIYGLSSYKHAKQACRTLKKHKISCIALNKKK